MSWIINLYCTQHRLGLIRKNIMTNAKILIVEDENTISEYLKEMLKNRGYCIAGAVSSGEEAIRCSLKVRPDLILMDIALKGDMDGVEAARKIHEFINMPIVYLTGHADTKLLERAKITEPFGYILKPFLEKELLIIIEMALYKHKTERRLKEFNEILEQRITERTAELEKVNNELIRENNERRRIERTLKESEEKFRMISASAHDAIVIMDYYGKISYWNKAAERTFDYPCDMVIGKKMLELILTKNQHEAYSSELECLNAINQSHFVGKTIELTANRRDGNEILIELSLSRVKVNEKWNAIAIIRDISERRRMEKKLREEHKMASIERLISGLFHELLNPLNIISSHIQLLLMDVDKGSMAEKDLNSINEEVSRIENITKDLMSFTKKEVFVAEELEMNSLLEKVTFDVESEIKSRNIKFVKKFEDRLPEIMINHNELRLVFLNLIENAFDAMPEGGTLTISTESLIFRGRSFVRISFADTGYGIETENIHKIYEPFFSTKKKVVAVGQGLSQTYGIIKNHGGSINVESTSGKGATFTVDLPIERRKTYTNTKCKF